MKLALLLVSVLSLGVLCTGCVQDSRPAYRLPARSGHTIRNGCVLEAIAMDDVITAAHRLDGTSARHNVLLVYYQRDDKIQGHALCVFEWKHQVWVWDARNDSQRVAASYDDPMGIARCLLPLPVAAWYWERYPNTRNEADGYERPITAPDR